MKKRHIFGIFFAVTTTFFLLIGLSGSIFANNCGKGKWVNTGMGGPHGYFWHYDKQDMVGSEEDAKKICGTFYKDTNNCKDIPFQGYDFWYNECHYRNGIYTIIGFKRLSDGKMKDIRVQCQNC